MIGLPFFRNRKSRGALHKMLGREELQEIIDKERLRCDRNGSCFCLAKLELRDTEEVSHQLAEIENVLRNRLRRTDEVGMVLPTTFGIVLPDTPVDGAWTVIDDIIKLLPLTVDPPHCSVYSYPTEQRIESTTSDVRQPTQGRARTAQPLELLLCQKLPLWKRSMDLAAAGTGLMLLSPLFLIVALLVKLTSKGPIFFRQARTGMSGVPFQMLKFRTMCDGAHLQQADLQEFNEQDGPAFKIAKDPRVTLVGRFLRRSCIDELPQLWNIVRGEMSLVGPRPLPCEESTACQPWQKRRLDTTPGLTCLWQVSKRSQVQFVDWMRLDLKYIRERSLSQDCWLIVQTLRVVMLGSGK